MLSYGLLLTAVVLIAGAWMVWRLQRMQKTASGRRRAAVWQAGGILILAAAMVPVAVTTGAWMPGAFLAVAGVVAVWQLFQPESQQQARRDFLEDPGHCGQCGYSTRGISRPTCPECGWSYPALDEPFQPRDWAAWWKHGWRIEYMESWRKTALVLGVFTTIFASMAITFLLKRDVAVLAVILPAVMAIMMGINLLRVLAYARRRRARFSR